MSGPTTRAVLRVTSYNLRDLLDDVDAAARVVRAIDPDVLLAQEVPRQRVRHHRISGFAERAGLLWSGGSRGSGGTTVLTSPRVRADDTVHHRLPVPLGQRERGWAEAVVRGPGLPAVRVVSLHLGLRDTQRLDHAGRVLATLGLARADAAREAGTGAGGGLLVVGGDLNETENGGAWRLLARHLQVVSAAAPTFPTAGPRRCIDALFTGPGLVPATQSRSPAPYLDAADLRAATDHLPVWVDLRPA